MKRGFSLLEVLVVIAIIGLLAALAFPVFARVMHDGRRVTCISNLRQLGLAVQMYQEDSDGRLPVGTILHWRNTVPDGRTEVGSTRDMIAPLKPYAGGDAAFRCPENDGLFLPRWVQSLSPVLDESRLMVPTPGTVLAECHHHLTAGWSGRVGWETYVLSASERQGFHLALHADGSVGKVDAHAVIQLTYGRVDGTNSWLPATQNDIGTTHIYDVFPEENWPPEWIALPENPLINWGHGF